MQTVSDMTTKNSRVVARIFINAYFSYCGSNVCAQSAGDVAGVSSSHSLKNLPIEELFNVQVKSVSRRPEKLTEAASAVQVITNDEIRRSGATNLPGLATCH